MTLEQRFNAFDSIIEDLQSTNSRVEKEQIISSIPNELKDDWQYILEILAGKHKLGYTYDTRYVANSIFDGEKEVTFKEYIQPLFEPMKSNNFTVMNCVNAMSKCRYRSYLIASIVNRTLRLGIGPSQLPKDGLAPMLAKKFEDVKPADDLYYITEKLDGNRCIAKFDGDKWLFISRNGKPLKVNIDMGDLPTDVVYDGELLSPLQTYDSERAHDALVSCVEIPKYSGQFNFTSGLINSKQSDKKLVYNIFDVMTDDKYEERRRFLDSLKCTTSDTRILPVLALSNGFDRRIPQILEMMTEAGAEGLILNAASARYEHKRTNSLIKVKNTYTMDMLVVETIGGTGKYEDQVGSLFCTAIVDGKTFEANVGSGLSDEQRIMWMLHPEQIVGKIVEVAYFSYSQNATTSGTKLYSLRFPRLKRVRTDKVITSID